MKENQIKISICEKCGNYMVNNLYNNGKDYERN